MERVVYRMMLNEFRQVVKPLTASRLRIYAFLVYTRLAFYATKLLNEVAAFTAAYSPDAVKLRTKSNPDAPVVYSARVLCKRDNTNYNITNLANWVVDSTWDPTACGDTGGIQLNQLGHFTKYYNPDLIWICYGLSKPLNPSEPLKPSETRKPSGSLNLDGSINPDDSINFDEPTQETNQSDPDRHYILIDVNAPMHIFRYTRANVFDSKDIKKIADPMFGELSFDPNSTWE
jgi:hypothetical protein